jgi:RecA/RadA recombinase
MAKQYKLDDFFQDLAKIDPEFKTADRMDPSRTEIPDWINTGNYTLNAQISGDIYKGYPAGKVTVLAGESQTGKSFLCMNGVREAQKKGYFVFYIDTEGAIDRKMLKNFGIDETMIALKDEFSTILEVKSFLANVLETLLAKKNKGADVPKIMIVIDSLTQLMSSKEKNDALDASEKKDMSKAGEIKSFFRVINVNAKVLGVPVLVTSHVYESVGSFIPMKSVSGGSGLKYTATTTIMLSKSQLKDKDSVTGIVVRSKIDKNRLAKPLEIKFHISFVTGMNPYVGLQRFLTYETHGIGPGTVKEITKEVAALDESGQPIMIKSKPKMEAVVVETRYIEDKTDKPTDFVVAGLGQIPIKDLFTPKVWTPERLDAIRPVLQEVFALPQYSDTPIDEWDESIIISDD